MPSADFDLIIHDADVYDGGGGEPVRADVAISEGRIAQVGTLGAARSETHLDATGLALSPGFIDIHSHDDFNLPVNPLASGKIAQGVTTVVTGNCGFSPAPVLPERREQLQEACAFLDSGLDYNWESFAQFLAALPPTLVNIVPLVGHVAIRCAVMGLAERPPQPEELRRMRSLVDEAMSAGAYGFSTGLIYPPSCYGQHEEIVELAGAAARYGGGYFTHMRNEEDQVLEAIAEAVAVGRAAGAYVQISHLKVTNAANWGKAPAMLEAIDAARATGMNLHCDQYPYTASSTGMKTLLPSWVHDGGVAALLERLNQPELRRQIGQEVLGLMENGQGRVMRWEDAIVSDSPSYPQHAGRNLAEIAVAEQKAPVDILLNLLIADKSKTLGVYFCMSEEDIFAIMRHPAVAIGSDGLFLGVPDQPDSGKPHPRYFGTFPRVAGRYTRDTPILTLPEAIRKMTGLPAQILGLKQRGRIAPGFAADLVLFDPHTLSDTATFEQPRQTPKGIQAVLVNGRLTLHEGKLAETSAGMVLRRSA